MREEICKGEQDRESSESWLASILAEFFHATVEVVGSSGVGGDELEVVAEYRRAR